MNIKIKKEVFSPQVSFDHYPERAHHMIKKPKPMALVMAICDVVIDDKTTGKKSLVGLFNNITTSTVPCAHPRLNVFLSLTEGTGVYTMRLRCLQVGKETDLFGMEGQINFQSPKQIVEFNFEMINVPFPDYGEYRFEVLCDSEPIIARRFQISQSGV